MKDLIEALGRLEVTQGRQAGQPFKVMPWQKRFIRGAFAPGVSTAALSVARVNGKSTLLAGVACEAINGVLAVPRAETLICAASHEQGRVIFNHVLAFMGERLGDRKKYRVWDTVQQCMIADRETGASLKVIGSDPRRAHGLAPVLILADEGAQWGPRGESMVAALRTAAGKQPSCKFIALGTRPADATHWFAKMLDGGADYSQTHAASVELPPFQKATWAQANPSLKYMPDLEYAIRKEAVDAKTDESVLASFRALRLNQGTSDVAVSTLLDADTWAKIEGNAPAQGDCYWGIDLGTSAAMSAVTAYFPETGRLESLCAFPREPSLAERGLRDGVGNLYSKGWQRGELVTNGGQATDVSELITEARARFGTPRLIGCDRWRDAELRDALDKTGMRRVRIELRGQGYRDGGEDVRTFQRACLEGKVTPLPSLILASAIGEARTITDPAGNAKLSKKTEGGRRLRARDDAAAAAILAVSLAVRQPIRRGTRYIGAVTA